MKRLVCISGKRFSGKDTLAALIRDEVDLDLHAFAAESKRLFAAGRPEVDLHRLLHDRDYKERLRPELTRFTVDAIAADPLVFCRSVADRIAAGDRPCLVTDLRLRLEVAHLRSRFDLVIVRIVRSDAARAASGWVRRPEVDDHPTETELDDPRLWDEVVPNDGTLAELRARALRISRLVP